ncbi:LAME_0E00958g1_1 [Lachancea meyersii CBS 8951]|uniref:Probable quinone oxidoreductase n=1 Tax=Lachancea meyersii CBS 8951 TaxID=1266667 RepID=A0A1G4JES7_9SACH|nr:LAME_0E00958g1_1 [Lachancea meyersii CBS 8951]
MLRFAQSSSRTFLRTMSAQASSTIPKTQKAWFLNETGDLDVVKYDDFPVPKIGDKDVLVKNKYAGVNFIEAYYRKGIYPLQKPYVLGQEASGTVVAIGEDVQGLEVNDKVAYVAGASMAQYTKVGSDKLLVKLPASTSDDQLKIYAASMISVLTALTFTKECYSIQKGDFALLYAAAGSAGLAFDQTLKKAGARVIAVASTDAKLKLAQEYGAEFLINSSKEDILERVQQITNGEGVSVVYDSVGKDTFETTLDAVKRKGTVVSYGNASGPVEPVVLAKLSPKNVKLLRPRIFGYLGSQEEWEYYSNELVTAVNSGEVTIPISKTYSMSEYKQAATELEARKTTGKTVLEIS